MALKIKRGTGAWVDVANGNLKIRSGGAWQTANYCWIASGGVWRDSGYRGYPNAPQSLAVSPGAAPYNWSFSQVTVQWAAPAAGGAPVSQYRVVKTDANGNWVTEVTTAATSYNFGVSPDERCRFYVRAESAAGLVSGFIGPVNVQIGHAEQGGYVTDNLTRAWDSTSAGQSEAVNGYRNTTHLRFVPLAVEVSSWYFNLRENPGWAISKISPGTNREVYHVFKNVIQWGTVLDWSEPLQTWASYIYWGEDNWWGFYVSDNTGWTGSASGLQRFVGEFRIHGTEHYTQQRYVVNVARVDNSFW